MWLIDKYGKDIDVYIPVSDQIQQYNDQGKELPGEEYWEKWNITQNSDSANKKIMYLFSHKERNISFELSLPYENGKEFLFWVLRNSEGKDLIIFGNLTERHYNDSGFFGYIEISDINN